MAACFAEVQEIGEWDEEAFADLITMVKDATR